MKINFFLAIINVGKIRIIRQRHAHHKHLLSKPPSAAAQHHHHTIQRTPLTHLLIRPVNATTQIYGWWPTIKDESVTSHAPTHAFIPILSFIYLLFTLHTLIPKRREEEKEEI